MAIRVRRRVGWSLSAQSLIQSDGNEPRVETGEKLPLMPGEMARENAGRMDGGNLCSTALGMLMGILGRPARGKNNCINLALM